MFTEGKTRIFIYVAPEAEAPAKVQKRRISKPVADRIADLTAYDEDDRCWHWKGSCNPGHGYPQVTYADPFQGGKIVTNPVHKALMEARLGRKLGFDEKVCHAVGCSKDCVNPHHHRVATNRENIVQAVFEGRHQRNGKAKRLTTAEILAIARQHGKGVPSVKIAGTFNVCVRTVMDIAKGRRHAKITGLSPAPKSKGGRPAKVATPAPKRSRRMTTSTMEAVI